MLTLDTNVLFYAFDSSEPAKRRIAADIFLRLQALDVVITTQVLGEFINAVSRKNPAVKADAIALVESWSSLFSVVDTKSAHLLTAARLADRYKLQFWDSLIIAVARSSDVEVMLTEDMQDGATIDGMTLLNPFNPANRAALDALLAP
ncbi:PIN domain-containing protein [Sphingomonas psychrolutea]|uniref:Twitching motility protein PilT n=1 Tax=Sphingomonas psychrolutea TaxID=1259676 RepID=A0ABQ1GZS0_9SPHN|nr:PIN domain-containing protein [Sphingomonas psychrolutea]GGA53786.1 twitching motility protein PilT [Sphingomonas psychrolutea]